LRRYTHSILVVFIILIPIMSKIAYARNISEYKIKAGFIYNFARFTQWPESTSHINICLYGKDNFGSYLDDLNGKMINGKSIKTKRIRVLKSIESCNVVFLNITPPDKYNFKRVLNKIKNKNILTMSDTKNATDYGVMVGLVIENGRVGFNVNYTEINKTELKISSQLLKLAKKVI